MAAAGVRGQVGGRPPALDEERSKLVVKLYNEKEHSVNEICRIMEISKATPDNYLRKPESSAHAQQN